MKFPVTTLLAALLALAAIPANLSGAEVPTSETPSCQPPAHQGANQPDEEKIPFIYSSDLFHPAMDPDDHFDLAALFAMPRLEVKALILDGHIDRPGQDQFNGGGRIPLSQMEHIAGRKVPAAVGLSAKLRYPTDTLPDADPRTLQGVNLIRQVLQQSQQKVIIKISTGTDLAVLFNRHPDLCRDKIKAVYFSAGHSRGGPTDEYNALLDPIAYARIFETGLPLFWNPCFDTARQTAEGHCSFYKIPNQRKLLAKAPPLLGRFFSYALRQEKSDPIAWLKNGTAPDIPPTERWMWTPPVLAHAAGLQIFQAPDGGCQWLPPNHAPTNQTPLQFYTYRPAKVTVQPGGHAKALLQVQYTTNAPNVQVFTQLQGYPEAMESCLQHLYQHFPQPHGN